MAEGAGPGDEQRLDKWLWHGRFVKTRTLASRLIASGMVRVNREKITKPSHSVRPGDVITAAVAGRVRVVRITGIGERRGPPAEARTLYEDLGASAKP
jgi:ribosome-associated heat shock protein Hsp15